MNKPLRTILALSLAVPGMLLAGLVTGALAGLVASLLYIVLLFPLGMGLAGGFLLQQVIHAARIRSFAHSLWLGGLLALAVYAAYQGAQYLIFRGQAQTLMHQQLLEETRLWDPLAADLLVDLALEEATGFTGFPGYILYKNQQGLTLGKLFRSGLHLGPSFTWAFWALELALLAWVTLAMGKAAAARRFCAGCERWLGQGEHLGGVGQDQAGLLKQLLDRRDFAGAGALLGPDAGLPSLELYVQGCTHCAEREAWLELKWVSAGPNGKLRFETQSETRLRPHETAALLRAAGRTTGPLPASLAPAD